MDFEYSIGGGVIFFAAVWAVQWKRKQICLQIGVKAKCFQRFGLSQNWRCEQKPMAQF